MKAIIKEKQFLILKAISLLVLIMGLYFAGNAQVITGNNHINSTSKYVRLQRVNNDFSREENVKLALNIAPGNNLELLKESVSTNILHRKYQQYSNGIEIKGAVFFIHDKQDGISTVNGKWLEDFNKNPVAKISKEEAVEKAVGICKAMGQKPLGKKMAKQVFSAKDSEFEGSLPKAKTVWYSKDYSNNAGDYVLAYEIDVYVSSPFGKYRTYIDAVTGELLKRYDILHHDNIKGTGTSNFYGEITFTVDSVDANTYKLEVKQDGHAGYTTNDISDIDNVKVITDSNNIWGEEGEESDRAAIDAHWGTGLTLEYYEKYHGRNGMDDKGSDVSVNVHVTDDQGNPMANAFYSFGSIYFGDGDGNTFTKPFTALNIVAHEFTHGVTENEAGLIYEGESGAMNESMSDIFGITVEYFMNEGKYDWKLGEELGFVFRVMNDPKSKEMPATYKGEYWVDGADVHVNSSIGNLWYALLVDGGSGTNDLGNAYAVQGIGFEKASKIVYEVLTNYLTTTSNYADFRSTTIEAAIQLYGRCSEEYLAVADAWYAVGIGATFHDNDLSLETMESPATACRLGKEDIVVDLVFNSCQDTFELGSSFDILYTVNNADTVRETVVVNSGLGIGETYRYVFNKPADLTQVDTYNIVVWIERENDGFAPNNTLKMTVVNKLDQNEDFSVDTIINAPTFFCSNVMDKEVKTILSFNGCDSIRKGVIVPVQVTVDGKIYNEQFGLSRTLYNGDTVHYTLKGDYEYSGYGIKDFEIKVKFPGDPFENNNIRSTSFKYSSPLTEKLLVEYNAEDEFEIFDISRGKNVSDSISGPFLNTRRDSDEDDYDILFTGGNFMSATGVPEYERPSSEDDVWNVNKGYISRMCKCVDAQEWDSIFVDFDYAINSNFALHSYLQDPEPTLYSNMRLTVDGEVITGTYHSEFDNNFEAIYKSEHLDLSQYAGSSFSLCFELQNVFPGYLLMPDSIFFAGDDIELDNIYIGPKSYVATSDIEGSSDMDINAYPLPAKNYLHIDINDNDIREIDIALYDVNGIRVSASGSRNNFSGEYVLDLRAVPVGTYYMKIVSEKQLKVIPVVKIK